MDLAARLALLALALAATVALARAREHRRAPGAPGLAPGLTLVTGPGCALCGPAERELRRVGAEPTVVDVSTVDVAALRIGALPAALVADRAGRIVVQRTGQSALRDAVVLAAAARSLTGRR